MNPDRVAGQPPRLGALLAVLSSEGALLYLSPELQRLLNADAAPADRSPTGQRQRFWSVVQGQEPVGMTGAGWSGGLSGPGAAAQSAPPVGEALVRLHCQDGRTRTAHMGSTVLPEQQVTLLGFRLESGDQVTGQLGHEQLAQLLYQFPVAAVGVGLAGQLLYVNARAIRNADMIEGAYQNFLGLNNTQYSELRGQDTAMAERRTQNFQLAIRERRSVSWTDQVQLPGQPPEYWKRSYTPVYNDLGDLSLIAGTGIPVTDEMHRTAELELLCQVAQNSPEAILVVDLTDDIGDSRIIFANRVALRLLADGERRPLTGRSLYDASLHLLNDAQRGELRHLLRKGHGTSAPLYYAAGTPSERCLELTVRPGGEATTGGSYSHLCLTIRDVTEADRAGKLERGRSRALQLALSGAPLSEVLTALVATLEGQLPGLSASVMLLRGDHLYFEAAGGLPEDLKRSADARQAGPNQGPCSLAVHLGEAQILADIQQDARFQGDWALAQTFGIRSVWSVPFRGKQGKMLGTFAVYGQRPRLPRPRQLNLIFQLAELAALLTESRQASDRLERVAYHDALTDLPSRPAFMQTLESRLDEAGPGQAAVAILDLTGFRAINEAHGQAAGNRVLQQVAGRLHEQVHPPQGQAEAAPAPSVPPMLARLGGDEFALLIPDLGHSDEVFAQGERLRRVLAVPFQIGEQLVTLRANIGWSLYPDLASDAATLISQADTAMYTARQEGQFQRLYSQHGGAWSLSPTTLRAALETALDHQQLHLVYQPLIGRGGQLRSFEALLRWTHPEFGHIGPDQFIPVAETSGTIRHIGLWVLEQATRAALDWPGEVLVSVNISGRQFEHPGFAAEVAHILARTGLSAERLELELTESALMTGDGQAARTLKQLEELGVRVALDDYGVGYSNLMRLHTLPISTVKLDRSFTRDLPGQQPAGEAGDARSGNGHASAAIIRSVVGLAHDLGLEVVAEGIETREQLQAVLELQCDAVQGYFYSRPIPAQAVLEWLRARP